MICDTAASPYEGGRFVDSELENASYFTNIDMNYCAYIGTDGEIYGSQDSLMLRIAKDDEAAGTGYNFDVNGKLYGTNQLDAYGDDASGYVDIPYKDYMQTLYLGYLSLINITHCLFHHLW